MNKTLTVNIGGMVFHIEEHAYEKMKKYLDAIRGYFTSSEGRDEIIQDVESRIAEMFTDRLKDGRQVVDEADVDFVINLMGKPEQFAGDESTEQKTFAAHIEEKRSYRKLYRDPDDKIIAGVCSGLSHRLGVDPIWLRLAFALIFFIGGGGILLYLLLVIIIPKAETTAQKLEMRGESVNLGNIRKAVEEPIAKKETFFSRFFDMLASIIKALLKFLLYVVGGLLALAGIVVLFALFIALMAILGVAGISIPIYISDLFLTTSQQFWSVIALFLVIGIPVIMLIYAGIKILFGIKKSSHALRMTAIGLMITGWIIAFYLATVIGREFSSGSSQRSELPLIASTTDTMFVDLMENPGYEEDDSDNRFHIGFLFGKGMTVVSGDESRLIPENVSLDIQRSLSDKFELIQIKSARGATEKTAFENASKINYNLEQKDSLLKFSRYFPLPKGVRFRNQKVKLILKVPTGKSVHLNEGSRNLIYDVKNVTNTYDGDMINHTWTMTERGLECIGCNLDADFSDDDSQEWNGGDAHVKIDKRGIHIRAADGKDSITYKGKDVNIRIDENGVVIDSKK